VTVDSIAASTTGFTGADLANLINEAALLAGRSDKGNSRRRHSGQIAHPLLFGLQGLPFDMQRLPFGLQRLPKGLQRLPVGCRVWQANLLYALLLGPIYAASDSAEVICVVWYSTGVNSSKSSSERQMSVSVFRTLEPHGSTCQVQSCCCCFS